MPFFPVFAAAILAQVPSPNSLRVMPQLPDPVLHLAQTASNPVPRVPPAPVSGQPAPSGQSGAARSLVEAELAFAKMADQEGTSAAFMSVLDDKGVLFHPGPVNGKAWLRRQKPDASELTWYPSFVEVSEAGDLGYSTGPYQWRAGSESKKVSHGHFVSVWGLRGGTWKLLLDMGSPHTAPSEPEPVFEPSEKKGETKTEARPTFSAEALQSLEKEFSQAASVQGLLSACSTYLASDARIYRLGSQPTARPDDIRKALEEMKGTLKWTCLGSAVARSNDLGYAYGVSEHSPDPKAPSARRGTSTESAGQYSTFLHVWKCQPTGQWKVILDIENPIP